MSLVEGHLTDALYELSPTTVMKAARRTEHALGDVKRKVAESVLEIVNWTTPYAFTHVMHYQLEQTGTVPTFQSFRDFCAEDPRARQALWEPARHAVDRAASIHGKDAAQAAMRWRIGNFYYSFLRELHVLTTLREAGLDVRFHPLADALFRVDAWLGENINISLYIGNQHYKGREGQGRKQRPQRLLADAGPAFHHIDVELPVGQVFGRVHLPDAARLADLARNLRQLQQQAPVLCVHRTHGTSWSTGPRSTR